MQKSNTSRRDSVSTAAQEISEKPAAAARHSDRRIAEALQWARGQARDPDLRSAREFALRLRISPSQLSMYESGARPIPAAILVRAAEVARVDLNSLMQRTASVDREHPFLHAVQFLQHARDLGIEDVFQTRSAGLLAMTPFLRDTTHGKLFITASSLRGVREDVGNPFVRALAEMQQRGEPAFDIQAILTYPKIGDHRAKVEGRVEGSISAEIVQGVKWLLRDLRVPASNIKFLKASPSMFSLFIMRGDDGLGLLNSYPAMAQAFTAFSLIVRPNPTSGHDVFSRVLTNNFHFPWNSADSDITVDLVQTIQDCKAEPPKNCPISWFEEIEREIESGVP